MRRNTVLLTLSIVALLATAGCTLPGDKLKALRRMSVPGGVTPYEERLAREYYLYAESLRRRGDSSGSELMASLSSATLYGHTPPTRPPAREANVDLRQAYGYAAGVLSDASLTRRMPQEAAALRFYYDCWAYERLSGKTTPQGDNCRESFFMTLEMLHKAKDGDKTSHSAGHVIAPHAASATPLTAPKHYAPSRRIRVPITSPGTPSLKPALRKRLMEILKTYRKKSSKDRHISIEGYSYVSDKERTNVLRSGRNAEAVKNLLLGLGFTETPIDIHAMGSLNDEKDVRKEGAVVRFY